MNAQELAALLAYTTAMAFTPGPNTTLSSALAANGGLRHAMRFVLAVPLGWTLLLLACSVLAGRRAAIRQPEGLAQRARDQRDLIVVDGELGLRLAQVLPLMVAYGFASNFCYALVGALLRRWPAQGRRLLWFNRAMAGVLAATALWMILQA